MNIDPAMNSGMMYNNPSMFSMGNPTLNRGYGSLGNRKKYNILIDY